MTSVNYFCRSCCLISASYRVPHWESHPALPFVGEREAHVVIVGLTLGTSRAQIARAALEAIAYQTADVIRCFEADAGLKASALQVDGGATVNDFLMQFQADILGIPVRRPWVLETTALGAAYLAGLAVGFWPDRDAIRANWQEGRRFEPGLDAGERERALAGWRRAVERSRGWAAEG